MIARWMIAAMLFGVLVSLASAALDRLLRGRGRQTRHVWSVALVVSVAWPAIAVVVLTRPAVRTVVTVGDAVAVGTPMTHHPTWWQLLPWPTTPQLDALLVVSWVLASLMLLAQAVQAVRRLHRLERAATPMLIAGEPVLVSAHLGPAVFGLVAPRIVVPAWLLDLDASLQTMVLRHEREHCVGRDPWLVWLAVLATIAMPWNVAVWWTASRLRLAMELDCDARTLRALPERPDAYARLLLLIAQRGSGARFVPALAHTPSQLARRIAAMTTRPTLSLTQGVGALALLAGAVAGACSRPVAGNLAGPAQPERQQIAQAPVVASREKPVEIPSNLPYFDFQVEQTVQMLPGARGPAYPEALRATRRQGSVLMQYVVNASGEIDLSTVKVLSSSDSAFSDAVRAALSSFRYAPALVGGKAVKQLVQTPFAFSLTGASTETTGTNVRVGETPEGKAVAARRNRELVAARASTQPTALTADEQAALSPEFKGPIYPEALRGERVEGSVLVMLVVNADGTADMPSLKVLKSDHPLFTESVKTALSSARFRPATVQGKAVRQLMQLPFEFKLAKD